MANIDKKQVIQQQQGLPTKEQLMMHPEVNKDTVPAMLTENEFVFSVPSIIALGEGNYEQGLQILETLHSQLKTVGEQMAGQQPQNQGLAAVPME